MHDRRQVALERRNKKTQGEKDDMNEYQKSQTLEGEGTNELSHSTAFEILRVSGRVLYSTLTFLRHKLLLCPSNG